MKGGSRRDGVMLCFSLKEEWQKVPAPRMMDWGFFRVWPSAGAEIAGAQKHQPTLTVRTLPNTAHSHLVQPWTASAIGLCVEQRWPTRSPGEGV